MDVERLIELYPRLYHMAEEGAWPSIKQRGLMSASAVLDHFDVRGRGRAPYETAQREEKMTVLFGQPGQIVLRDQKPMPPDRLRKALTDGTTPAQWYKLINEKVFFWAEEKRLLKLLGARAYRHLEHDVLILESAPFIRAYAEKIWLCHMNSGNTWPMPHPRGIDVFKRIPNYPANTRGKPVKRVVELVVDHSVPDMARYVVEVRRMRGSELLGHRKL